MGQTASVDDEATPAERTPGGADEPSTEVPWFVDAGVGAVSIVARSAVGLLSGVLRSAPGRAAEDLARRVSRPLSEHGQAVRVRVLSDGVPAAQEVVGRVTPAVVDAVDLDSILDAIDVDAIVARVDVPALLERVDLDHLLERIDLDALIAGVDLDALLGELDLNAIVDRLDVDALIANTEMGAVIVRSTGGVAAEALDAVRSQGVSIDSVIARLANRLLRRDPQDVPDGPPLLVPGRRALPAPADDGESDRTTSGEEQP